MFLENVEDVGRIISLLRYWCEISTPPRKSKAFLFLPSAKYLLKNHLHTYPQRALLVWETPLKFRANNLLGVGLYIERRVEMRLVTSDTRLRLSWSAEGLMSASRNTQVIG